ncbi:MAG: pyridine nucleotide-disulfide oxidoreductase [Phenylobacterium sp.]|uniref:FAD/NAD(P)-binding protein n=1 Tax=Phenylobacterium sp. TaxID=1871053 RepID=UPI0012014CDF|nr:FAD/NAD(P)-binding protein [Phenylobacterium sp.]TAJ71874.1 MAG: pyridine nucleotide-disulfide oxidoreductase [Phenylobacterium sp.]
MASRKKDDAGRRPVVAVIGGGFSGLLTAIHLLQGDPSVVVRLVERAPRFGRGRAYSALHADHVLNVRAANMSAFPDRPGHFVEWLAAEGEAAGPDAFVSRSRYGDYLQALLREEIVDPDAAGRLLLEADEAVSLISQDGGWRVELALGRAFRADACVLAVGLLPPAPLPGADETVDAAAGYVAEPWRLDPATAPEGDVLLLGSGLTMVDVALSLAGQGRRLLAVSRHGLVSRGHGAVRPAAAPQGGFATPVEALRTLRRLARSADWRGAVDAIRPITADIWRGWPPAERRRFLRHARPWWEVHRHRMAPAVATRVASLAASGELTVAAGKLERLSWDGAGFHARIRGRGETKPHDWRFDVVINCTGPRGDPETAAAGLLADLRRRRAIRRDPLGLGLDVTDELQVVGADGKPTAGLFAVGPLTRAAVWEALAVPDLRNQTAQAARAVLSNLAAAG